MDYKPLRRILRPIAATLVTLPLMSGCVPHYTLNGSSINYDIYKTVDIGYFPIRAALVYPPLQQT